MRIWKLSWAVAAWGQRCARHSEDSATMKRICLLTMTLHIVSCITTVNITNCCLLHYERRIFHLAVAVHPHQRFQLIRKYARIYPSTTVSPLYSTPYSSPAAAAAPESRQEAAATPPVPSFSTYRTDAPMLGYIFDMHSSLNKHHHHDHRWGPHFDEVDVGANATNITVQAGSTANLNCRIRLLQDKTVSWVRRKHAEDDLQLLTVGMHTYSGDSRYTVEFQYPNNWRLQIKFTNKRDEGLYECQISTHPPKVIQINLHINAPEVIIVDEQGRPIHDKYYEADSTIQLSCIVRHVAMTSSVVSWLHGDRTLNYDTTRGGISVKTNLMEEGANSLLSVARVNKTDSGNYTCSISTTEFATVTVHVLNESLAELHHGSGSNGTPLFGLWIAAVWLVTAVAYR